MPAPSGRTAEQRVSGFVPRQLGQPGRLAFHGFLPAGERRAAALAIDQHDPAHIQPDRAKGGRYTATNHHCDIDFALHEDFSWQLVS
ncbi:hypothetical protein EMIT051CA3_21062 [Pseudomonas chlororaphis]